MKNEPRKMRALFMPEGSILAHIGRSIPIAQALSKYPFDISFASSGDHAARIEKYGWKAQPVFTRPRSELFAQMERKGNAFTVEQLEKYVEDERRVLAEVKPDVVIGDFRPSLCISASSLKIPYVSVVNAVWTRYCAVRFDPPRTMPLTRIFGRRLLKLVQPIFEKSLYKHFSAPFNTVGNRYGVKRFTDIRDCMCSDDLTLLPDVPEYFPCSGMPAHYRFIGPVLWEAETKMPEWTRDLDRNRPIIYVTMGSTGALGQIESLARSLAAKGLQVICTTATEQLRDMPKGVFAAQYGPGGEFCAMASAVVCHAGNGTIYQALSRGCPVIGVPTFHDQEFNMQRVEALGVGCAVYGLKDDLAARVERAVDHVLNTASYRARAKELQESIRKWDAPQLASDAIAGLMGCAASV